MGDLSAEVDFTAARGHGKGTVAVSDRCNGRKVGDVVIGAPRSHTLLPLVGEGAD
jgi:hypothetical protein